MEIKDAQQEVDAWISQFKEGYWHPLANLARLVEEVGELSREINHQFGQKPKKPTETADDLALELGDIFFVVLCIANSQGIDMDAAFRQVMEKYHTRDHERWSRVE